VGFIRHLPHDLVAAFKATLTETREAELLLHVVDIADERRSENIEQVEYVLKEIEASDVPQLIICNKIDKLDDIEPRIDRNEQGLPIRVWLSAQANVGTELLYQALAERLDIQVVNHFLNIPPNEGKLRGELYKLNCITSENFDDKGYCHVEVNLPFREWQRLLANGSNDIESFIEH
jgi:GTP-binding protein HflX